MSPSTKKGKGNHEKLSKLCAKSWWKLKVSDRTNYNEAMKIQLLSPFLYGKVYQDEIWIEWARSANLLSEGRTSKMDELTDEELKNTDLMELAIIKLQEKIILDYKRTPTFGVLEGIIECIDNCEKVKILETVLNYMSDKDWFCYVKLQLLDLVAYTISEKCEAAILLVAWQISFFVKAVYKGDKQVLQAFVNGSSCDTESDAKKEEGNEYFKEKEYSKAIATYTTILYAKPYLHIVYGNRALCFIRKQQYRAALADGRRCMALNPKWYKGQKRYAEALFELGYSAASVQVLTNAINICEDYSLLTDLQKYLQEIKNKIEKDNQLNNFTSGLTEGFRYGMKNLKKDKVYEDSDSNESEDPEDLPPLVSDDDDDSNDEEDITVAISKNKKSKSKVKEKDSECVPSYIVGSLLDKNDKADKLAKRRHEERVKKEADSEKARTEEKKAKVVSMMKKASLALLEEESHENYNPMNEYKKSIDIVHLQPNVLSRKEVVILHYAHAVSYLQSGKGTYIVKSIEMFTEITVKFKDVVFPLPYLGIGKAYWKQNNFSKMKKPLRKALQLDTQLGCLTNCCWPGVHLVINETLPGNLKIVIDGLLKIADNPPVPDTICCYKQCKFDRTVVYFSDPDFDGLVKVHCTEKCTIEYHRTCWLKVRSDYPNNKACLKAPCVTNDCDGSVKIVQIYKTPDGELTEEFVEKLGPIKMAPKETPSSKVKKKKKNNKGNTDTTQEEDKENSKPVKGKNKKKKAKQESSDTSKDALLKRYNGTIAENWDFGMFAHLVEEPKYKAFEIFNFIMNLLEETAEPPYIDISNNRDIETYQSNMVADIKRLVEEIGGLRVLLSKCDLFTFDERERNILFLTSRRNIYQKYKIVKERTLAINPPECEDALFNSKLLKVNSQASVSTNGKKEASRSSSKTTDSTTINKKGDSLMKSLSVLESLNSSTVETSNFSIEEVDPKTKTVNKVHVITIDGRKDKTSDNASSKALQGLIDEHGRSAFDVKKKCSECGHTVIDGYLCKCIDAKKYVQKYEKPGDNALGVYTLSHPPHNKSTKTDPVSKWFEQTLNEDSTPKIEEITDENEDDDGIQADLTMGERRKNEILIDTNKELINKVKTLQTKNEKVVEELCDGCVVNVGIQTDLTMDERRKNEILMETNKGFINKVKTLQTKNEKVAEDLKKQKHKYGMSTDRLRSENVDLNNRVEKMKKELIKCRTSHENEVKRLQNDKKEALLLVTSLEEKIEQISTDNEKKLDSLLMQKAKEIDETRRELSQIRREREQEKHDHEEIVQDLTQNVYSQSRRGEQVEVALLEAKKETVVMKYQQQAHTVQNNINQMQYLSHLPEMQQIRKIWEDYKIEYQACYEKMQEEFDILIQTVKNGHPLESLPPAKYATPPPYPHCPMPVGKPQIMNNPAQLQAPSRHIMSHQGMVHPLSIVTPQMAPPQMAPPPLPLPPSMAPQLPPSMAPSTQPLLHNLLPNINHTTYHPPLSIPVSTFANGNNDVGVIGQRSSDHQIGGTTGPDTVNKTEAQNKSIHNGDETTQGAVAPPVNSAHLMHSAPQNNPLPLRVGVQTSYSDSDEESEASSKGSGDGPKYGKMDEKVLMRLGSIFPTAPREELAAFFNDYRKQGPLSGQRMEDIVNNVERMIRRSKQLRSEPNKQENIRSNDVAKVRKVPRVQGSAIFDNANAANKRTRANQVPPKNGYAAGYSTSLLSNTKSSSSTTTKYNIFGQEEPCVICYEDMAPDSALLLHCGHTFHKNCISCWLKEQRTCPVCRVLALLPEEYPALSAK